MDPGLQNDMSQPNVPMFTSMEIWTPRSPGCSGAGFEVDLVQLQHVRVIQNLQDGYLGVH